MNIFRVDKTNVGDWWSPPSKYFPIRPARTYDLINSDKIPNEEGVYIVGGGGLGNDSFAPHLEQLARPDRRYKLVAWGVGSDVAVDRRTTISDAPDGDLLGGFFKGFDDVGTRVFPGTGTAKWVPCASCMHPDFVKYRDMKPTKRLGVYSHKRVLIQPTGLRRLFAKNSAQVDMERLSQTHFETNAGADIEKKLKFLSSFEYILTNTYHGVYWATLLNRKVICLPFKSGLFTFKHKPIYISGELGEEAFENARSYENALEECRKSNVNFYCYLCKKYDWW